MWFLHGGRLPLRGKLRGGRLVSAGGGGYKAAMGFNLHRFANPGRFLRLASALLPWLSAGTALLFAIGLYLALIGSPPDYQQHDTVRIMYVHVPSAWVAMMGYVLLAAGGASAIIWRHPLAEVASEAIAPVGAAFTFVALASGSLWGKPTWGTYWEWDARLTSFLLLFFLYVGHIALTHAFDDRSRGRRSAAILAIVGVINVPIIKYSVDWWNTLHQGRKHHPLGWAQHRPVHAMAVDRHVDRVLVVLLRGGDGADEGDTAGGASPRRRLRAPGLSHGG